MGDRYFGQSPAGLLEIVLKMYDFKTTISHLAFYPAWPFRQMLKLMMLLFHLCLT